jgi:hypothetical protein
MSNARELAELGGSYGTGGFVGMKNRIINPGMVIDQRNAGASVTGIFGSVYPVDRWAVYGSAANKCTAQRSSTAPTGLANSVVITSSAATSFGSTDEYSIWQKIEGLNVADLGWGAAGASSVTLSFWVRSSLTGTFGGGVTNGAYNRSYVFSYTISAANTWEYKTVTIQGDTSGTWVKDNGNGLYLAFDLGSGTSLRGTAGSWGAGYYVAPTGATSVLGTNAATFYITGVQLEKGSTATSFDFRSYGTELALCQRYCVVWGPTATHLGSGSVYNSTDMNISIPIPVPMRSTPTPSKTTTGGNWLSAYIGASGTSSNPTPAVGENGNVSAIRIYAPSAGSGWTVGQASWCQVLSGATFTLSAEL